LVEADRAVDAAEEALTKAKANKRRIETETLLALFDEADVNEVTLPNGAKAKRTTLIEGSLPKPGPKKSPEENEQLAQQRRQAFAHIIDVWEVPELIKCDILVHHDKGEYEAALRLFEEIRKLSNSADVALIEDIHPQTLQAEVRRRLVKGEAVPTELLGITALPAVRLTKKPKSEGITS